MKNQGFTLTELLVVIAILAILAAIAFPLAKSMRTSADRAACASNLRQIGMAWQLYVQDRREFPDWEQWYLPGNKSGFREYLDAQSNTASMDVFSSPVAARQFLPRRDVRNTYAMNFRLSSRAPYGLRSALKVLEPSRMMHFMLGVPNARMQGGFHYRPSLYDLSGIYAINNVGAMGVDRFLDNGHSPILYFDGHVGRISRDEAIRVARDPGSDGTLFWQGVR
jgi:prepilin-type N-terminal cleavage/methylation domain-containing protein/prepilin-type processing-associated H-X9-DG protein